MKIRLKLKISSILALCVTVSDLLIKHSKKSFVGKEAEIIEWRSEKLLEISSETLKSYIYDDFNKKDLKKIEKFIDKFFPKNDDLDIVECISFIMCAIEDIIRHSQKHKKNLFLLHKRLKWVLDFFDPKLDKIDIYNSAKNKYLQFNI